MRVTSKGQVTIPIEIREKFGLLPETEVDFRIDGNTVRLVKTADRPGRSRGEALVGRLRGSSTVRMTTDQILAFSRGR